MWWKFCCWPFLIAGLASIASAADGVFAIRVLDEQSGRGVPLVELKTVTNQHFVTDSAGVAAIREPELFGQTVFFHVSSHGYEFPKDGFGFRGKQIKVESGGEATLKIKRLNVAERLYRVTGAGIYADSVLLGEKPPIAQPLLNAQVAGSDSVVTAKVLRSSRPLVLKNSSSFATSGAVASLVIVLAPLASTFNVLAPVLV